MSKRNGKSADVCAQTTGEGAVNLTHLPADFDAGRQPLLMRLDIYEEAIFRTSYLDGQPMASVELHPHDLAAAMAGLETGTGLLPANVLFVRQLGPECHAGLYLPPAARTLRLGAESYTVPMPPLVFAGQGTRYAIYALAEAGWPAPGARLYQAPLPNVHTGGGICAGDVRFPACEPHSLARAADLFFGSYFNQHLRDNKSRKHQHNVLALYRELRGAETYPLDDLVPLDRRLEDLLK